jgi:DNA-binding PadR family transcriptional regulator
LIYTFLKQLEEKGLIRYSTKMVGIKKKKESVRTIEGKELCKQLFKHYSALVPIAI